MSRDCAHRDRIHRGQPRAHRDFRYAGKIDGYEKFAQSVQPWNFGEFETKRTCLWIKRLKPLVPVYRTVEECRVALKLPHDAKPIDRVHKASPGPKRWLERSKFFPGIGDAMREQWLPLLAA